MKRDLEEVIFNSTQDITIGLYIDKVKSYLLSCPPIENTHDVLLAYNCSLYIENEIRGIDWTQDELDTIKENTAEVKRRIGKFLSLHPSSILDDFSELSYSYKKSALRLSECYGCYKKWDDTQVKKVLDDQTVPLFLLNAKISGCFKKDLTSYFDDNPLLAAKLILEKNKKVNNASCYSFPFSEKEKAKYLSLYINSDKTSVGGLLNVLHLPSQIKKYISPKDLAIAKRKYEEDLNKLSVNNLDIKYCTNIRIEFRKMKDSNSMEYDEQTNTYTQSFSLDELCSNLDARGIFRSLYSLFDFIGNRTGVIPLANKTKEKAFTDLLFSNDFLNGYNMDFNQDIEKNVTYLTLLEYYDFLVHQGVSIEDALGEGFSEIVEGFGIKGFNFCISSQSLKDYRKKCELLAPRITELYKQLYICLRKEEIDDYYINAIHDIHWGELKSLFPAKYLYVSDKDEIKQKIEMQSRLMFSNQRAFVIDRYEGESIENNFSLFLHHEIGRKDIHEAYNDEVDYLLKQKCLVEKDGALKPTMFSQILQELWYNDCISLLHTTIPHNLLVFLINEGWLVQSDALLTKSEQDLLAFLYGDKFDDSLGIRNTVLHISNCGYSEDDHKQNYLWMIYIIIVLELKFLEELEFKTMSEDKHKENNQC